MNTLHAQQKNHYIGAVSGLMKELNTLAPHPDFANYRGPLYIANNPYLNTGSDTDSMAGCMLMEALVGSAFTQMFSQNIGSTLQTLMDALDCYSEYSQTFPQEEHSKNEHGQGTLARLSSKPIKNHFNMRANINAPMQAFYNDLPRRMKIEQALAYYIKKIKDLDQYCTQDNQIHRHFAA